MMAGSIIADPGELFRDALMKTKILYSIDTGSRNVKHLYDLISWGREARSEYIFYSEIDEFAVKSDGTGDLTKADFYAEVHVSFEMDTLEAERQKIESSHRYLVSPGIESIKDSTPIELLRHNFGADNLYISGDSCSCFQMVVNQELGAIHFEFIKILEDRVTKIESCGIGSSVSINKIYTTAAELIKKYSDIPYFRFTGAIRE